MCTKLLNLKSNKGAVPDNLPPRILKEFTYELAVPVATIFNKSLLATVMPSMWRDSHVTPVPKSSKPSSEGERRPISLTPVSAKVLDDFVVSWMLEDIGHIIDAQQFGSRKGSSTTYCLLDLIHSWLSALDEPEKYLRACVLDFSKAFDRVKL